jgi:hypothetical protein
MQGCGPHTASVIKSLQRSGPLLVPLFNLAEYQHRPEAVESRRLGTHDLKRQSADHFRTEGPLFWLAVLNAALNPFDNV